MNHNRYQVVVTLSEVAVGYGAGRCCLGARTRAEPRGQGCDTGGTGSKDRLLAESRERSFIPTSPAASTSGPDQHHNAVTLPVRVCSQ